MIQLLKAIERVARPTKDPNGEVASARKQIVATPTWVRMVEEWCKQQPGQAPTFSDAVRVLVERAIRAERGQDGKR